MDKKQAKANKGPKHNQLVKWNRAKMQRGVSKPLKFIPTFGNLERCFPNFGTRFKALNIFQIEPLLYHWKGLKE
jgi:hypothetical protein